MKHVSLLIMRSRLLIIASSLMFTTLSQVSAQNRMGMFWNYTVNDGLPSNEVFHIHEDANGYMWFATSNGISRYDGYEFINYDANDGILDSEIFQIEEDTKGKLYLYSINGRIYKGDSRGFSIYRHQGIIDSIIQSEFKLNNFIAGFIIIEGDTLNYINPGVHLKFSHKGLLSITRYHDLQNTIIDRGEKLIYIPPETGKSNRLRYTLDSLLYKERSLPFTFLTDTAHTAYLPISNDNTVGIISSHVLKKWTYLKWDTEQYIIASQNSIHVILKDWNIWESDRTVWVEVLKKTPDNRLLIGLLKNQGVREYLGIDSLSANSYNTFLGGFSVSFIYLDRDQHIWISTTNGGVFRVSLKNLTVVDQNAGRVNSGVNRLSSNKTDVIFYSDHHERLNKLDLQSGMISGIANYRGIRINDLHFDLEHQELWFTDHTLRRVTNGTVKPIFIPAAKRPLRNSSTWIRNQKVTVGNNAFHWIDSGIWIASSQGIVFIDHAHHEDSHFKYPMYGNNPLRTYSIFEQSKGHIWLGTHHGVYTYNLDTILVAEDSILSRDFPIYDIERSARGMIFGSKGGGVILHDGFSTLVIDKSTGLSSNYVACLLAPDSSEIWAGTNDGLNRITFDSSGEYRIQYYTIATGLPSNSINDLEYCDGKVYVATTNGLGVIDPEEEFSVLPVKPVFRDALVNNEIYPISPQLQLKSAERNLIIRYDCLDYKQQGHIQYRYRLNQRDDWHTTKEREVNLLHLLPGEYTFAVQALGADRNWSASAILNFNIAAPIWKKSWFWVLVIFIIAGFVYAYIRSRFQKLRKTVALQQRITELERSALRSQMNPHFIFNVLHSIQGYIVDGDSDNATRYIAKFARLIRATLNNSRMTKIPLDDEIRNLKEYLDLENMRLNNELSYTFIIDKSVDTDKLDIPPMLIQPFLENAIKHGISPKGNKGNIEVFIALYGEFLQVEIMDDGIGIGQSLRRNKKTKSKSDSLGVSITKERLAVLDKYGPKNHVEIKEMKDTLGKTIGTKVLLKIKVEHPAL